MKNTGKIFAVLFFLSALSCSHDGTAGQDDGDFVSVPGGTFNQKATSGTPDNFDHTVSSFKIAQYEVTYELWCEVRGWAEDNGYEFANEGREGSNGTDGDPPTAAKHEPVTMISWRDAIVWCNAYSDMAGLTPVYTYDGNMIKSATAEDGADFIADLAVENWNTADGYRLPSEGEWQYAAGYIDSTNWLGYNHVSGDTSNDHETSTVVTDYAWYSANSDSGNGKKTHNVGTKTANQLAIHDMSGNVYEWCWDRHDTYPESAQTNYRGGSGTHRIWRGGSYNGVTQSLQIGERSSINTAFTHEEIGFRVAKTE